MIPNSLTSARSFVLRRIGGKLEACRQLMSGRSYAVGSRGSVSAFSMPSWMPMLLFAVCIVAVLFLMHALAPVAGVAMAIGLPATVEKPDGIKRAERDLRQLAVELQQGQAEMALGPISEARGKELHEKAVEMEAIQKRLDQYAHISGAIDSTKRIDRITLPTDERGREKRVKTSAGHLFVLSEELSNYKKSGMRDWSAKVAIKTQLGRTIVLRGEAALAFEAKAYDSATLSSLGTDAIIETDRDRDLIRYEEPEILTLRDILTVTPTSSDSIRTVRHTSTTRAAASQDGRGAKKGYLKVATSAVTVPVETIAVLSKVTEQDLDDAPRLVGFINGEMSLDVRVEEERQLAWGDGENGELTGLFDPTIELPEFDRAGMNDTVVDTIRRMRTDLRKKRVTPNFVALAPEDWEEVELAKGDDNRYIWAIVNEQRGPRIWSLRVVESDAMEHPTTLERRILMGDGIRGATIYDRHDVRLAVGLVDDDFERNLRTMRAEERIGFLVKRPWAFTFSKTQAPAS